MSVPEAVWIHELSTAHPGTTFRVVAALAGEESVIGLVELREADPVSIVADLDRRADVVDVDLLWKRGERALVQVESVSPPLLAPLWRAGVPIEVPFAVEDGVATWELTTSSSRLSALGRHLDEAGVEYTVDYRRDVGETPADRLLTDRQREVLLAALAAGYYATPREATLTEVADDLGVSKATCSEVLHRAEGSVLAWFAEEHVAGGASTDRPDPSGRG